MGHSVAVARSIEAPPLPKRVVSAWPHIRWERTSQQLAQGRFDTVVTDIAMPDEDGYALLRRTHRHGEAAAAVPAIALTAYAGAEDQRRVAAAGFVRHLAKPVAPGDLVNAVGAVARAKSS